ncbi:hypothetical protein J4228_01760 [Candidatus Woesearchaeota archaeon]|nr:hypothetical protein [Candidatus Woesearchaeota archaeon]
MTKSIPNVSPIEEIEQRYENLHQSIQRRLTDHYNRWLSLHLVAYGNDWQREDALGRINDRISNGRPAFPVTPTIEDFVKRERNKFSESDRIHLRELQSLRDYANEQAERGIPRDEAQLAYGSLVIMLYGSHGKNLIASEK